MDKYKIKKEFYKNINFYNIKYLFNLKLQNINMSSNIDSIGSVQYIQLYKY